MLAIWRRSPNDRVSLALVSELLERDAVVTRWREDPVNAMAIRMPTQTPGGPSKAALPVRQPAPGIIRQAPAAQVDRTPLAEPEFTHDFSQIRIHASEEMALARLVGLALSSHAQPLPPAYQRLGASLGADLADVRVHSGRDAAIAATLLDADAFTVGRHVVLGIEQTGTHTSAGRRLLVHELVHVAQQVRASGVPSRLVSEPRDPAEREAHTLAENPRPPTEAPCAVIHRAPPNWNFTPRDFAMLRAAGGALTIAPDSGFFPAKLQENLLKTLSFVLGPTISPPATEGVNAFDFFHGHLVVKKDPATAKQAKAAERKGEEFQKRLTKERTKALGGPVRFPNYPLKPKNVGAYQKAVEKVLPSFGSLLDETSKVPGAAMMYHTFEFNQPRDLHFFSLVPEDPRRHYVTPLDTNSPEQYTPPSGGYEKEYTIITSFVFLVDDKAAVHVRPLSSGTGFTTLELSTITGTTFPEPLEFEEGPQVGDFSVPGVERPVPTAFPT